MRLDHPVVVMGVSGSGKSVFGAALSRELRVPFLDGDDLHPASNVAKMSRGEALTDQDRRPWLDAIGAWLAAHADGGVMACSALKRSYRDRLRHHAESVEFVLLHGEQEVLERRLAGRSGHFMPAGLLSSQLSTLEPLAPDENGLTLDLDQPVEQLVAAYVAQASV